MKKDIELSNVSYTNKDFFDIYPELLQLAKRLSAKWDPTVSNESDPGVVLIKELALIGDKINYIADKYALENNPRSVTQIENARQLYNLLGYYPRWYESSKVNLSLYWSGDKEENVIITIPKYTGIQDANGEFVYTTRQDITLPLDGNFASGEVQAIEGTYNRLVVNNSEIITLSMLSDDQRIYINNYNVATNGIFVSDTTGTIIWTQVDNVNLLEEHATCYSFNVDLVTGECYLQFPRDIAFTIGDGLQIGYIVSKGAQGNIPINQLDRLVVSELNITDSDGQSRTIDTTNIAVTNSGSTYLGKDPETIDEMYQNWKHVASTFDTLVTLRDYNNCIRRYPDILSNGFITDRTNDVQLSYKIMNGTAELPNTKIKVEKYDDFDSTVDYNHDGSVDEEDESWYNSSYQNSMYSNKLTPYGLKLYGLRSFPYSNIDTYDNYDSTFQLFPEVDFNITDSATKKMLDIIDTYQCISHDFAKLEPEKICFLKNKYNIDLQILPNQELTDLQARDLKLNICRAIYNNFNSSKVEFGEKIDYDDLLECIKNSDNRIKTAILDRLVYDTYAVFYIDNGRIVWIEVPVSDGAYQDFMENTGNYIEESWLQNIARRKAEEFRTEIVAKNILAGITPYLVDAGGGYPYSLNSKYTLYQEADHVKTNVVIPLNFTADNPTIEIELSDNEVIQISKPNLLELRTYGAYIYYEYIGKSIDAGDDYQLKSDESICFFYKEADKDSKYRFDLYGQGTIISPSMRLEPNDSNAITAKVFGSRKPTNKGECLIAYQGLQSTRNYDGLSVSDSIAVKKINQITLGDPESYIYFITNDVKDNKYQLVFDGKRRILTEGEYFIYTNASKTSLEILGSGTEIKWIGESSPYTLTCDYVPISDVALYGSTPLRDKWVTIKSPTVLQVIEKSFTNALAGDVVSITLNGTYDENNMQLDSQGLSSTDEIFSWAPDPAPTDDAMIIRGVNNPTYGSEQKTVQKFVGFMYDESYDATIKDETMSIQCINIREGAEDEDAYLYAWKCVSKTGAENWILDEASWNRLFGDEGLFDSVTQYASVMPASNVAGASTGYLTTIPETSNPAPVIAGNDSSEPEISYTPTALEIEAYRSWSRLFAELGQQELYLQQYITYFENIPDHTVVDADSDIIYITYNYTAANDRSISLAGFTVRINDGDDLATSNNEELAPEIAVYLNLDLGPDNPQLLRYDPETGITDQMYFYLDNTEQPVASVNVEGQPSSQFVYASGDIFKEGSSEPIDVRLLDEHLKYYNPIFYAYRTIESPTVNDQVMYTEKGASSYINFGKAATSAEAITTNPSIPHSGSSKISIFSEKIKLPEGDFIISVAHSNSCLATLKLYFDTTELKVLGREVSNIAAPDTYFLTFHSDGNEHYFYLEYALKNTTEISKATAEGLTNYTYGDVWRLSESVTIVDTDVNTTVTVQPHEYIICKRSYLSDNGFLWTDWARAEYPLDSLVLSTLMMYEYNDQIPSSVDNGSLYDKIDKLDYDHEFNYLYEIPEKKMIKNPLKAESFLNVNHVYNKFTICEAKLPEILA